MKIDSSYKDLGQLIRFIILICGAFAVSILIFFVVARGWEHPAEWGAFGDFVGGLLNPIFAFVNVIVLVVISYQLSSIEDTRAERDLETQKKIALYSLKHEGYLKLVGLLDKVHLAILTETSTASKVLLFVKIEISVFFTTHSYLFPVLAKYDHQALNKSIGKIITAAKPFEQERQGNTEDEKEEYRNRMSKILVENAKEFFEHRSALILLLYDYISPDHVPQSK